MASTSEPVGWIENWVERYVAVESGVSVAISAVGNEGQLSDRVDMVTEPGDYAEHDEQPSHS